MRELVVKKVQLLIMQVKVDHPSQSNRQTLIFPERKKVTNGKVVGCMK